MCVGLLAKRPSSSAQNSILNMQNPVVRGFIPVRLRSSRQPDKLGLPDAPRFQDLGLLRSPSGINPLATKARKSTTKRPAIFGCRGVLLSWIHRPETAARPSRASPLPQGISIWRKICAHQRSNVGAGLLAKRPSSTAQNSIMNMQNPVVRGFIPVRLRSSRQPDKLGLPDAPRFQDLGLLRSPSGINPLATKALAKHHRPVPPCCEPHKQLSKRLGSQ
jgi:hypothetical protein